MSNSVLITFSKCSRFVRHFAKDNKLDVVHISDLTYSSPNLLKYDIIFISCEYRNDSEEIRYWEFVLNNSVVLSQAIFIKKFRHVPSYSTREFQESVWKIKDFYGSHSKRVSSELKPVLVCKHGKKDEINKCISSELDVSIFHTSKVFDYPFEKGTVVALLTHGRVGNFFADNYNIYGYCTQPLALLAIFIAPSYFMVFLSFSLSALAVVTIGISIELIMNRPKLMMRFFRKPNGEVRRLKNQERNGWLILTLGILFIAMDFIIAMILR